MQNCSDHKDVKSIQNIYPYIQIGYYQVPFLGTISVFTLTIEKAALLKDNWRDIYSSIAAYFQSSLPAESEFEKWNIYLFYICREEVEKELQYKIENDRFASRKIVLGNCKEVINDKTVSTIINQHITNSDLKIDNQVQQANSKFIKSHVISKVLALNKPKISKKESDIEIQKVLADLENKLK